MLRHRVCWLAAAGLVLLPSVGAVGYDDTSAAADEWTGRRVLAKSPAAVLRAAPDENSATIPLSLTGVCLVVQQRQGDWLNLDGGWLPVSDAIREEGVVEHFTGQLKQGESAFSYLGRARGWLNQNDFDKAQADVSEALRIEPQSARAYFVQARIAAEQQRGDEELANYDRALGLAPRDAVVLGARGELLMMLAEYDRAIRDLEAAIEVCPADFRSWAARGYCRYHKGEFERASADFAEAVRRNPGDGFVRALRAVALLRGQDVDQALTEAQEALRLEPKLGVAFAARGFVYAFQGKLEEALFDLNEAIRLGVTDGETYAYRAYVQHRKGNFDAAVLDYTQAISLHGDDAELYHRRAAVWEALGDNANAIADLGEFLKLAPQAVEAYVQRGRLRIEPEADGTLPGPAHLNEALDDFQQALRLDPRHVKALIQRAFVRSAKNEPQKAMDDLAAAISINPNESEAYQSRGNLWLQQREWQKAIADLNEVIRLKPDDGFALYHRALCWIGLKQFDKAIRDADEALKLNPKLDFVAKVREIALRAKDDPSNSADPFSIRVTEDRHSVTAEPTGPFAPSCYINLQGPTGLELAFESSSEQFGPPTLPVPNRLAILDNAMLRIKLVRREAGSTKALYARLDSGHLSKDDADLVMKAAPSLPLTTDDLELASSGANVTKVLVLIRDKDEQAGKPEFEVLTSTPTKSGPEVVADAARRGTVIAALSLSPRLPEMTPLLQPPFDDRLIRFVRFSLRGPAGLLLAHKSAVSGKVLQQAQPVPTEFAFPPGIDWRFQLTGAPVPDGAPLYGQLSVNRAWPAALGPPGKTELAIEFSKADFEAAAAGKPVTQVIYWVDQMMQGEPPRFETLNSRTMPPESDPVAEASRHGKVLATVRLAKELPAVQHGNAHGAEINATSDVPNTGE